MKKTDVTKDGNRQNTPLRQRRSSLHQGATHEGNNNGSDGVGTFAGAEECYREELIHLRIQEEVRSVCQEQRVLRLKQLLQESSNKTGTQNYSRKALTAQGPPL